MQIAAVCLLCTAAALVVRRSAPELALAVSLAGVVMVALGLRRPLEELLAFLREVRELTGVEAAIFAPLCKTVAIAAVVKLGGNLCADAGESALKAVLELGGSLCALTVALPLLRMVVSTLMELIGG